jgi:uncharacterized protein YciI
MVGMGLDIKYRVSTYRAARIWGEKKDTEPRARKFCIEGTSACNLRAPLALWQTVAMFVIELNYKADLSEIDKAMRAHMVFLNKHYRAGTFLLSGRKIPRDGGVILAVGPNREAIEGVMREDPFCAKGLAEFRVIEFRASQRSTILQTLLDAEPSR